MIKETISITQPSYNLECWKKALFEKCIADNPNQSLEYIASLLGIFEKTLHRMKKDYKIILNKETREILRMNLKKEYLNLKQKT